MRKYTIPSYEKNFENISLLYASLPGGMINTHSLKLPLSRIYFHCSKGVQAIEVLLYQGTV